MVLSRCDGPYHDASRLSGPHGNLTMPHRIRPLSLLLLAVLFVTVRAIDSQAAEPLPVIIDTDIGSDIDDAFALGLAIVSPELEIVGITTVGGGNEYDPFVGQRKDRDDQRAWLVTRFLTQARRDAKDTPVAAGADPQPKAPIDGQIQYRRHPAAIYNRTLKPVKESAVELMTKLLTERDGVTIIALGPLTNIARLIEEQPAAAKQVKRIVVMGGSVAVGYDGKPKPEVEWNIKLDIKAAQTVFASKVPLLIVPLDATGHVALTKDHQTKIFAAHTPLTWQLQNLFELWNKPQLPVMFDPVAVTAAFDPQHLTIQELPLVVTDEGMTVVNGSAPKVAVATKIDHDAWLKWLVARLSKSGTESLPKPPQNVTKLIDPGKFPARVHAFEDYETDIEKRWMMCGKVVEGLAGAPSKRVCASVLTQDFDDRQGQTSTMYRAVIFNPVPGPPMGPNTRLRFRYKLVGTDTLRIQLYSLTNGYHRYLSLTSLEQNKWLDGCVDMTQMRRTDGTGGPLAENERIDDIQFYVDPRAEVFIDDIVLYEAAVESETRPFPKRIIFTGWFDTGKQGKEWPGKFDIVEHAKPRTWKFAQSVKGENRHTVLNVSLRGPRTIDPESEMTLMLQMQTEHPIFAVQYLHAGTEIDGWQPIAGENSGEWQRVLMKFNFKKPTLIDEVRLTAPGNPFGIDDLLIYTP